MKSFRRNKRTHARKKTVTILLDNLPILTSRKGRPEPVVTPVGEIIRYRLDNLPANDTNSVFFVNIATNEEDALEFDRLCLAVIQRDLDLSGKDRHPKMPLFRDKVGLQIRSSTFHQPSIVGNGPPVAIGVKARIHGSLRIFESSNGHFGLNLKVRSIETVAL